MAISRSQMRQQVSKPGMKKIKKVAPPKKGFTPSNVYLEKKKNE